MPASRSRSASRRRDRGEYAASARFNLPRWMPCRNPIVENMLSGMPMLNHAALATSIACRVRSSHATISITCGWPPCETSRIIRQTPARCTLSPSSIGETTSVSHDRLSVPGNATCSPLLPMAWSGTARAPVVLGTASGAQLNIIHLCMNSPIKAGEGRAARLPQSAAQQPFLAARHRNWRR